MNEGTTIQHAPSTNGRVRTEDVPAATEAATRPAMPKRSGSVTRLLVPAVLVVTALIVLRRMQRGNYA